MPIGFGAVGIGIKIYPGYLDSWSDQLDEAKDRIDCGESRRDRAIHVERHDQVERCERVQRLPNGWFTSGDLKLKGEATAAKSQRQAGARIVIRIRVKAKETLNAWASGEIKVNPTYKLRPKRIQLDADETGMLQLQPKRRATRTVAEVLKRGKVPTAKLTVKLTDPAGNREIEKLRVRLRR